MMKEKIEEMIDEIRQKEGEVQVLFICSGNIMRSPFAEYRARQLLDNERKSITFKSGGVIYRNTRLSSETHQYLVGFGLQSKDLTSFRPMYINDFLEIFEEVDLILVMEENHLNYLENYIEKSFLLTEFVGETGDVLDPYFERQMDIIYNQLNELVIKLVEILSE